MLPTEYVPYITIIPFFKILSQFFWIKRRIITVANWGNPNYETKYQQNPINHCTRTSKRYEEVCYRIKFLLVLLYMLSNLELRIHPRITLIEAVRWIFDFTVLRMNYTGTMFYAPVRIMYHVWYIVIFMGAFYKRYYTQ